jgi:hypothetical protein
MKSLVPLVMGAALALGSCAAHRIETPAAAPKSAPARAPASAPSGPAAVVAPAAVPPAHEDSKAAPIATAVGPVTAPAKPPEGNAPPATESAYVFSPQQAAVAHPSAGASSVPAAASAAAAKPGPSAVPSEDAPRDPSPQAPGELQLAVIASAPEIATGAIVTVDVMASSNSAVVDAPLHLTFDPSVVEFVDGTPGDFLAQGGSSVVFFADGRTRPGDVAVAAGRVERAVGASGAGLLCRVRFRGTGAGTTPVLVGRAKAWGVHGEELIVSGGGTTAVVR